MHYSLKSELLGVNTKMGFLHCEEKLFYKQNMCTKLLKLLVSIIGNACKTNSLLLFFFFFSCRSVFNPLEKQLVALYLRDFSPVEQCVQRLHLILRTFEEDFRRATGAISNASNAEVAGGLMVGLGLVLAPVHQCISALITGAGVVVVSGAAIGDQIWNKRSSACRPN